MEQAVLFLGILCLISQIQLYLHTGDKEDFSLALTRLTQCQDIRKSDRYVSL